MRNSRTRNSTYSMLACVIYYSANILFGLANRKFLISILGIEYQGVNGLFGSVLNMLSIAELGIGTAIIYHLYRPLANGNKEMVGSIMHFYKNCYRGIALVMLTVGMILSVKLDFFVTASSLPVNIHIVYYLMLADVIATYTFAYKRSILYADQKNYIVAIINTFFVVCCNIVQVGILYWTKDYYLYLSVKLGLRLLENISINIYVSKHYAYLSAKKYPKIAKDLLKDIIQKIKGLLFHKIGTFVVNGTSNILISKFLGLALVGIYSNYYYVISAINSVLQQAFDGTTGSVGNLLATEDSSKRLSVFEELNGINTLFSAIAVNMLFVLINPFIKTIFGDEFVLNHTIVILLVLNMIFTNQRRVFGVFKAASGIQYEDRYVPIAESLTNIIISVILLFKFGLAGIFVGMLVAQCCVYLYTFPILIYRNVMEKSITDYTKYLLFVFSFHIISLSSVSWVFHVFIEETIMNYAIKGCVACIQTILIFYVFWHNTDSYQHMLNRIKLIIKK